MTPSVVLNCFVIKYVLAVYFRSGIPMYHSDTSLFSLKGVHQWNTCLCMSPGLYITSFSMHYITQGSYRNVASVNFGRGRVVEYCANQNATPVCAGYDMYDHCFIPILIYFLLNIPSLDLVPRNYPRKPWKFY